MRFAKYTTDFKFASVFLKNFFKIFYSFNQSFQFSGCLFQNLLQRLLEHFIFFCAQVNAISLKYFDVFSWYSCFTLSAKD
jgi:hypothetical protein